MSKFEKTGKYLAYSNIYNDVYWSKEGGLEEKKYVFIDGNNLIEKWKLDFTDFTIFELGFGAGLNFLATWKEWNQLNLKNKTLHYISVEKFPLTKQEIKTALEDFEEISSLLEKFLLVYDSLENGIHHFSFPEYNLQLSLCIGDAEYYLKNLNQDIDAFYLDGFSPSKNPDMWSESIFNLIHRFSKLNSTFATYSVSSSVKENATKSGFQLEKRKGFGTKKGMLVGKRVIEKTFTSEDYYINEINNRQFFKLKRNKNIKDVIIIGAGLAGISLASKLAEKKIKTTIIEKSSKEGEGASGNPAGIYSPNLTADPTFVSRLTLSGYEYFYREILDLKKKNYNLQEERIGVFQNVSSQEELERILKSIERHELKNFTVERKHKKFIYNNKEIELDGFYLNRAGWVSPKQILSLKLNQYSEYINLKFNTKVEKIQYTGNHWELYDREERLIDSCKILILANSEEINKFPETSFIFLNKIRGQICFVPLNELPINLDIILTHEEGYIIQTENFFCVGATYNNSDDNIFLEKNHNILLGERLKMIFPEIDSENFKNYEGRVGFRSATKDRIPIVGQIPDLNFFETHYQKIQKGKIQKKLELPKYKEGLFTFGAFGSRGITFSFYLAQYLANLLNGEAITLEKDLIEGISPSRFIIRDLIKKQE